MTSYNQKIGNYAKQMVETLTDEDCEYLLVHNQRTRHLGNVIWDVCSNRILRKTND
ncbi:hypothetical protein [Prochlorococcus sp. MIT 0604]|uniref:hypothetical protein n=1 Tax=Prochlorococcus sp. MIT 0604 TaxID=1501268 RepID=UPI0004F6D3F4|nr:hypothetical protein [Prochlorococcus sp. MIT 0604]AIQ94726.1 hypothetical protein EW14_0706 [Prochlorococcus sp. MIT 0604]